MKRRIFLDQYSLFLARLPQSRLPQSRLPQSRLPQSRLPRSRQFRSRKWDWLNLEKMLRR